MAEAVPTGAVDWLANTSDGVFVVDGDQQIILWNKTAEEITGFSRDEVISKRCYELFMGKDLEGVPICRKDCRDMVMAKKGELPPTRNVLTRTKDGSEVCFNITKLALPVSNGESPRLAHIFRDVSHYRANEKVLEQILRLLDSLGEYRQRQQVQHQAPEAPSPSLTRREMEILGLLSQGSTVKAISKTLFISPATVRKHIQNIMGKLQVHSQVQAVVYASGHNLLAKAAQRG